MPSFFGNVVRVFFVEKIFALSFFIVDGEKREREKKRKKKKKYSRQIKRWRVLAMVEGRGAKIKLRRG